MNKQLQQKGFTLVELMLAMTFFSLVMMFVIAGFVQINKSYTRGLTQKNIQNAARVAADDITDYIRNVSAGAVTQINNPANPQVCIGGDIRFAYNQHFAATADDLDDPTRFSTDTYDSSTEVLTLVRNTGSGGCPAPIPQDDTSVTLIDEGIIVQHLSVQRIGTSNSFSVVIVLSTDTLEDFEEYGANARCRVQTGDEFCFVSKIETVVTARS